MRRRHLKGRDSPRAAAAPPAAREDEFRARGAGGGGPARIPRGRPAGVTVPALVLLLALAVAVPGAGALPGRAAAEPRVTFGAFVPGQPEQGLSALQALEAELGRRLQVVHWFQHWGSPSSAFVPERVERVAADGRSPLITWEPWDPRAGVRQEEFRLAEIARGRHDDYVRTWARALAAVGVPVYLRPMHEMNGNWYPWAGTRNGNSAAHYRAAWRRIHGIFRAEGAANVRWVWCVNARSWPSRPGNALEDFYPGRRYVDVLAIDGYNRGGTSWRSFETIFSGAYARLERLGPQPIWIAETASEAGARKAAWVRSMFATAQSPRFRRLEAIIWFSTVKRFDFRANSSPDVAAAFRDPRLRVLSGAAAADQVARL